MREETGKNWVIGKNERGAGCCSTRLVEGSQAADDE